MSVVIHEGVAQGSPEWLALRLGVPTASEFDSFIKQDFTMRDSAGVRKYLARKVSEKWQGHPHPAFSTQHTENGSEWELQARAWCELSLGLDVRQVGFVENGRCGCSPDGLIGEDEGLELKCPGAENHTAYLLAGKLPSDYALQVHGSLYVTGRKRWHFVSWRKGFPKFHYVVERDEEIMAKIGKCVDRFTELFDDAWSTLKTADETQ